MRSLPKTLTKRQDRAGELRRADRAQALAASCCAKSKPKMRCPPINGTHPPCWSDTCGCRGRVFRTPAQDHTARRERAERPEIRNLAAPATTYVDVSSRRLSGEVGSMRDGSWLGFRCLGRQRCQLRAGLLAQSGIGGGEAGYFAVARNQSGYSVDAPARFQRLRQLPRRPGPGRQRSGQAGKGREGGILGSKEFHQSPRPSPSRPYRRRHPDEQCRHLVGPIGCRSLRARSGRTPPSPALPITFTRMRASRTNALRSPLSAPHSWQITSACRPRCRREAVDLPSGRDIPVVLRPMRLLAVRNLKRSSKRMLGVGATASPARRYALDSGRRAARRGCHPNHGQPDETSIAVPGRRDEVERAADLPERSPRYCWIISPITRSDGGTAKFEPVRRCNYWILFELGEDRYQRGI